MVLCIDSLKLKNYAEWPFLELWLTTDFRAVDVSFLNDVFLNDICIYSNKEIKLKLKENIDFLKCEYPIISSHEICLSL